MHEASELTVDDVQDVRIPTTVSVHRMSIYEVVKMHYEAWSARRETEVFSATDMHHEEFARQELENRGWAAYPEDEWYVFEG